MYDHLCEMDDFSFLLELQLSHFIKLKVYGCKSDYLIKRLAKFHWTVAAVVLG